MNARADEFAALQLAGEQSGRRVMVVEACSSTQDLAKEEATRLGTGSSVVIIARRQTAGRGRLGRAWADTAESGLAMSLALDARAFADPGVLSIGVGLAACQACEFVLKRWTAPTSDAAKAATAASTERPGAVIPALGLRWPNDVIERSRGRKLAGVLIERAADLFIVGIGINCLQHDSDWPEPLCGRAVSLLELEPQLDRASLRSRVAAELLRSIDRVLALPPGQIAREWADRDALVGSRRIFEHAGSRICGLVESIDPLSHLVVRDDAGSLHRLPALTTSMVHDALA